MAFIVVPMRCDNAKCVYTENRTSQISKQGEIYAECEYNVLTLF